jgi:hypothetical protein
MVEGQFLARPHSMRPCPGDRRVPNFCALEVHRKLLLMELVYLLLCKSNVSPGLVAILGDEVEEQHNCITDNLIFAWIE